MKHTPPLRAATTTNITPKLTAKSRGCTTQEPPTVSDSVDTKIPFGHWARRGQDHPDTSRRDKSELVEVGLEVTRTNTRLGDSLQLSAWALWP